MNNKIIDRLKEIRSEDFIYGIFLVILIFGFIANQIEKEYFINKKEKDKLRYYYLQILIFVIIVLVNIYYVWISYKDVVSFDFYDNVKSNKYAYLDLIASLAALFASSILLYIAVTDTDIDAEISL